MPKKQLKDSEDYEPKPDPILDEIEELFDEIKERQITVTQTEENNELIISNLIVAYYLNKLEKKLK